MPAQPDETIADISEVQTPDRADLMERWQKFFGRPAPKGLSRRLLEYATNYSMQVRAFGGLKPQTLRALRRIAEEAGSENNGQPKTKTSAKLKPGARLLREWNGQTHQVEVLSDGFVYDGERYRSLSAVARTITGARWSGPRFFGL